MLSHVPHVGIAGSFGMILRHRLLWRPDCIGICLERAQEADWRADFEHGYG
jgi:hypothetical protein